MSTIKSDLHKISDATKNIGKKTIEHTKEGTAKVADGTKSIIHNVAKKIEKHTK